MDLFALDDGFPPKHPRMHWRMYRRLEAQDEELSRRRTINVGGWLERSRRSKGL